ncbi:MAG: hypothetical protein ACP5DQ_07885 [Bacteroidales bacterium]
MKKHSITLCFLLFLNTFTACLPQKNTQKIQTTNNDQEINQTKVELAIKKYLGDKDSISIRPNKKGNFILYLSETRENPGNPVSDIRFFVYDKSNESIIYHNNFNNAKIQWHSNEELKITRFYGITDKPEGTNKKYHIINILTGNIKELNQSIK